MADSETKGDSASDLAKTEPVDDLPLDEDAEVKNAIEPSTTTDEDSKADLTQSQSQSQQAAQLPSSAPPDSTTDSSALPASLQSSNAASTSMPQPAAAPAPDTVEARIPQKKDATLREFLSRMDAHAPIIPDAVTNHYLTLAGLPPPPQTAPHLARLLALATQKFVADVAADAYQYARIRSSHTTSNTANAMMATGQMPVPGMPGAAAGAGVAGGAGAGGKPGDKGPALGLQRPGYGGGGQGGGQGKTVLTMEDLGMAVGEYGVTVKRGEFYR